MKFYLLKDRFINECKKLYSVNELDLKKISRSDCGGDYIILMFRKPYPINIKLGYCPNKIFLYSCFLEIKNFMESQRLPKDFKSIQVAAEDGYETFLVHNKDKTLYLRYYMRKDRREFIHMVDCCFFKNSKN